MNEFELPKTPPPRFALPDHEWLPVRFQNFKEEIRVLGEWRLVRKIKFVPTADDAKRNLQRPPAIKGFTSKFKISGIELDTIKLTKIMGHLAEIVECGVAELDASKRAAIKVTQSSKTKANTVKGDIRDAAGLLHYLVNFGCAKLMKIAEKNPEILRPIARQKESWPMMMSKHPGYKVDHLKFLESLKQGEDALFDVNQTSRDGTQKAAVEKGTRGIAQKLYVCLWVEWNQTGQKLDGVPVPQFCYDAETISVWWKVAKARLLESYPTPHKVPELARISSAPSRKYPAQKKDDILRRLKAAFLGLAKNQSELAKHQADTRHCPAAR
jgi:hypothetical protein